MPYNELKPELIIPGIFVGKFWSKSWNRVSMFLFLL